MIVDSRSASSASARAEATRLHAKRNIFLLRCCGIRIWRHNNAQGLVRRTALRDARAVWNDGCSTMAMMLAALAFALISAICLLAPTGLEAQTLMQGSGPGGLVRIFNEDSAILEAQDPRKDLACSVNPIKPQLGFDMKFHAGYEISIPLRELSGSEDILSGEDIRGLGAPSRARSSSVFPM